MGITEGLFLYVGDNEGDVLLDFEIRSFASFERFHYQRYYYFRRGGVPFVSEADFTFKTMQNSIMMINSMTILFSRRRRSVDYRQIDRRTNGFSPDDSFKTVSCAMAYLLSIFKFEILQEKPIFVQTKFKTEPK